MNAVNDYIELGKITGHFGVKGCVKIFSHTRPRGAIVDYQQFYLGKNKTLLSFSKIQASGKNVIGTIEGITSREAAQQYIDQILFVKQSDLPTLKNEFYWRELIGLVVVNQQGQTLGKITEMMETGANDVMVIHNDNGDEYLIPYAVSHFVLAVNPEKNEILVDWNLDNL